MENTNNTNTTRNTYAATLAAMVEDKRTAARVRSFLSLDKGAPLSVIEAASYDAEHGNKDNALDFLARLAALGTLRRVYDASGNKRVASLRRDCVRALAMTDAATDALNADYIPQYDKEGKRKPSIYDKDAERVLSEYAANDCGVALDLYGTAYLSLLETLEEGKHLTDKEEETIERKGNGKEVKTRNGFQRACVAVRRGIMDYGGIENNGKTLYIEDYCEDGEVVLHRLPRYYDLGAFCVSSLDSVYTADASTAADLLGMVDALQLSGQQAIILHKRLQGKGYKDIAGALGISRDSVRKQLERVQAKAIAVFGDAVVFNCGKWSIAK